MTDEQKKILTFVWAVLQKHPCDRVSLLMDYVQREAIIEINAGHAKRVRWARAFLLYIDEDEERYQKICSYVMNHDPRPA